MRKNKKGFTLVELVIVIAVIAILAAVLLPTFAGIINRARANAALQRATSIRDEFFGEHCESYSQLKWIDKTDSNKAYVTKIYINENNNLYVFTLDEAGNLTADNSKPTKKEDLTNELKIAHKYTGTIGTTEGDNKYVATSDYYQEYNKAAVVVPYLVRTHVAGNFIDGGLKQVTSSTIQTGVDFTTGATGTVNYTLEIGLN